MVDVLYITITLVFFVLCHLYVKLCERILGPDPVVAPSEDSWAER